MAVARKSLVFPGPFGVLSKHRNFSPGGCALCGRLVGTGGIGKTRLGIELARRLLPKFADGVWLAEPGPLSDPELVLTTIATVVASENSVHLTRGQQRIRA
jgi:hypothetical protein